MFRKGPVWEICIVMENWDDYRNGREIWSSVCLHSYCQKPRGFFLNLCSKEFFFAFHILFCAEKRVNSVRKIILPGSCFLQVVLKEKNMLIFWLSQILFPNLTMFWTWSARVVYIYRRSCIKFCSGVHQEFQGVQVTSQLEHYLQSNLGTKMASSMGRLHHRGWILISQ